MIHIIELVVMFGNSYRNSMAMKLGKHENIVVIKSMPMSRFGQQQKKKVRDVVM